MILRKPSYYDKFCCIASRCPDTCCQLWDVQVDPDTAAFYQTLPGKLGEQVRNALYEEDGEILISMKNGHCPLEDEHGLCSLQTRLGHQALSRTCQEFPRLHHDYGSFQELELELSCPEAARIVLTSPPAACIEEVLPGGSEPEYDLDAMEVLMSSREKTLLLLEDDSRPVFESLALFFFWGCHVQALLDGEEAGSFDPSASLDTARNMAVAGSFPEILSFFSSLDILTESWKQLLSQAHAPEAHPLLRPFARYLTERYWLQAVSDYDLYCRVKFILVSCLVVASLPGDFIWNAHLFSKEIENDVENVDAILDAAYTSPIFTDDKLLGFLLGNPETGKV